MACSVRSTHLIKLPGQIFYVENATYVTNTALIKISLLFQYLRVFKEGIVRWICICLLIFVALWGTAFGFMAWFPCFPVRGYWDRSIGPRCYGYGYNDNATFIATFQTHTAINMMLDLAIFLIPLVLYRQRGLRRQSLFALTGLFTLGAVYV